MASHRLGPTPATVHWGYLDAKIPPLLTVDSGDTVTTPFPEDWPMSATPQSCCRTIVRSAKS
jgi:hypothetical protein